MNARWTAPSELAARRAGVQVVQVAAEHLGARGGEGGGGQRSARLTRSVPPPRAWLVSSALPVSWPALAER
jgi:hypothetical protein